jgi:hypothetical protein
MLFQVLLPSKEIRSIRQWSYEANRAIEFTIVVIPEDLRVTSPLR